MDHPLPNPRTPPFTVLHPVRQTAPLVFASPHSGCNYGPDFLASARLDPAGLRRSEDCFVDDLFSSAPAHGAPLLAATFPRAWCDPNREAWELDPAMFDGPLPSWVNTTSARVGAGLGTIARIVASGETIYRTKLRFSDAENRVESCWVPYHDALTGLIAGTRKQFGTCLLVDCHSMPSASGRDTADFVIGDAHGTSCAPAVVRLVEGCLSGLGYAVRRNDPYAGGYVTRHYGRPREGTHALQIEVSRALYMDQARFERSAGFATLQAQLSGVVAALAADAGGLLAR